MCAHGREGQTHIGFVPRHSLKEFCMARFHFDELVLPPSKPQSLELPLNADRVRLGRREGGEKSKQKC